MTLALGNSAQANTGSAGSSFSVTLSTSGSSGVLVLCALCNSATSPAVAGTASSSTLGSWGSSRAFDGSGGNISVEHFTIAFNSTLTSEVITFTPGGGAGGGFTTLTAFEINGCALTSYFDLNGSLPVISNTDPISISTSTANDFIFAHSRMSSTSNPTNGAGWTQIEGANFQLVEYKIVSVTQSGLSGTIGSGAGDSNGMLGDAIIAASVSTSVSTDAPLQLEWRASQLRDIGLPYEVGPRTYYVDNVIGSDSYNGTSPTFTGGSNGPWASIAHVNTQTFNGGDSVLFQGGQTFTDGLVMLAAVPAQQWNPATTNVQLTISNGGLTLTNGTGSGGNNSVGAQLSESGAYYFEGVATSTAYGWGAGNASTTIVTGQYLGSDPNSIIYVNSTGLVILNTMHLATLATYASGTRVCTALDLNNQKIWWRPGVSANWNNDVLANQNPATNTGGFDISSILGAIGPAVDIPGNGDTATASFASGSWVGTPPSGFVQFPSASIGNWGSSPTPSAAAPVTFGSYGTGNAIISPSTNSVQGFYSLNLAAIVIQNLTFTGAGASVSTTDGVRIWNTGINTLNFVQLLNLTASGFGGHGLSIIAYPPPAMFSNVTIRGCVTHDNTGAAAAFLTGINTYGISNLYIGHCSANNNAGRAGQVNWTGGGIIANAISGSGLVDINGTACGGLVEFCEAGNNGANSNYANGGPVGIFVNDSTNVYVQFCEAYANKSAAGGDGDGYDIEDSTGCVIQYCYSHDNYGAGFQLFSFSGNKVINAVVRYCISQNDGAVSAFGAGIRFSDSVNTMTGVAVYNNTIYSSTAPAIGIDGSTVANVTGRVCNNIIYTTGTHKLISFGATGNPVGLHFDGNNYFASGTFSADWNATNYGTLAAWKSGSGQETVNGGFSTDPKLTSPGTALTTHGYAPLAMSAYKLNQNSSTMIGAGLSLLGFSINPGLQDFWGALIPNRKGSGWNVGADGYAYSAFTYGGWGETFW